MSIGPSASDAAKDIQVERYKYILAQLNANNENVYKFLAIYQTIATALVTAGLSLAVGYRKWGLDAAAAELGVVGLLILLSVVAAFTVLLIVIGVLSWLDYRREECALTDALVGPGFRRPPTVRNFYRWYETYVVAFIVFSVVVVWWLGAGYVVERM